MANNRDVLYVDVDITVCSICQDDFTDPRSLPCVHTFCLECLRSHCGDNIPGDRVRCPLCRSDFDIPARGVDAFPKNYYIQGLLSAVRGPVAIRNDRGRNGDRCPDNCRAAFNRCRVVIGTFLMNGREVCSDVRRIANELNEHQIRVQKAHIGVAVAAVVTGATAVVGTVVSIATAGLLAPVAVAVVAASAAGASGLAAVAAEGIKRGIGINGVQEVKDKMRTFDNDRQTATRILAQVNLPNCACGQREREAINSTLQLLGETNGNKWLYHSGRRQSINQLIDAAMSYAHKNVGKASRRLGDIAGLVGEDLERLRALWGNIID